MSRTTLQTELDAGTMQETEDADLVPPLKWAGGKRWLVPHLRELWAQHFDCRLVEPFAGGLAVTFGLRPQRALLNDINAHLINFYKHLKKGLVSDIDPTNDEDTYYDHRQDFNDLINADRAVGMHADGKRAAMYFYYLNRHCYNGLCRFNLSGEFNTPTGRYANPKYERDLTPYKSLLKNWVFTSGDFEEVTLADDDFVYADPPYDDAFTSYSKHKFGFAQQRRLAKWLADHDGPVVLSNHATTRIIELYKEQGFDVSTRVEAPRMIHCFGDRTPAMEVIATRNLQA